MAQAKFVALVLGLVIAALAAVSASAHSPVVKQRCEQAKAPLLCSINYYRQGTWDYQDKLGRARTRSVFSDRRSQSEAYRAWVRELWHERYHEARKDWLARPSYLDWWQWDALAQCETGGDWSMQGHTYSGGLGFHNGVWEQYGGLAYAPNAGLASREEQIRIGYVLYQLYGWEPWGCAVNALGWS